jgi:hypothetical protein
MRPLHDLAPGEAEYLAQSSEERLLEERERLAIRSLSGPLLRDRIEVLGTKLGERVRRGSTVPEGEVEELLGLVAEHLRRPVPLVESDRDADEVSSTERAIARAVRVVELVAAPRAARHAELLAHRWEAVEARLARWRSPDGALR